MTLNYWYTKAATFGSDSRRGELDYDNYLLDHRESQYLNGNRDAQFLLGQLYEYGLGVLADRRQAIRWYEDAAVRGELASQQRLGYLYGFKSDIRQEKIDGYAWLSIAASYGGDDAIRKEFTKLQSLMTATEVDQGQERSQVFLKRIEINQSDSVPTSRALGSL